VSAASRAHLRKVERCRGVLASVLPEILEPIRRHFGVAHRVHDIFMAHIVLEGSGVMPVVGQLVTSGVPEPANDNKQEVVREETSRDR
jgi:hypothetical protein